MLQFDISAKYILILNGINIKYLGAAQHHANTKKINSSDNLLSDYYVK